jgi:putative flippase GtrA
MVIGGAAGYSALRHYAPINACMAHHRAPEFPMKLVFFYSLFAVLATAANIASQEIALLLYRDTYAFMLALLVGTATGLVVKFLLDRHYIFRAGIRPLHRDMPQFIAYGATGVLTTLIFWGAEIAFDLLYDTRQARYAGAAAGLTIGYLIKYQLDRRFVFAAYPSLGRRNSATAVITL